MNKTKKIMLVFLCFLFAATNVMAAESVTQTLYVYDPGSPNETRTYSETAYVSPEELAKATAIKVDFVTDGTGALTAENLSWRIDGWIVKVAVIPGATAPDASYNVSLVDVTATSVIGGALDAINGSASYTRIPQIQVGGTYSSVYGPAMALGDVTFDVTSNTTADANGTVWIFFVK